MGNEQTVVNHSVIVQKAKELADMISNSNEVDFYKKAEEQIKANDKVQELIGQIRNKQKEAVALEALGRAELIKKVEQEMDELHEQLDQIPLVTQFKQTQMEINDLLQMVTNVIANTVSERIIVSTGGDPLSGDTGYPVARTGANTGGG
ncbi:master regulator for biofilm formation [Ammoniphilus oxalaticus]|uniref:Master regulator for biofilm formation n=1 Tax=Ammoniphilus oxalaticus TaxID=66863 RepID=A0A419SK45_9BACL|nr:YlbF family regulator [Ammoniphilus oxalaticus]RKD24306.1 master regulator for biofilm formation [Ammoniphilus oxalaticus]